MWFCLIIFEPQIVITMNCVFIPPDPRSGIVVLILFDLTTELRERRLS